jgi:hypothetical protein
MRPSIPKSAVAALSLAVLVTLIRGLLGISLIAGFIIAAAIAAFGAYALVSSRKTMSRFTICLAIYGGAFALQAILLASYVGSRVIDIAWGLTLIAVSVFMFRSEALSRYYIEAGQVQETNALGIPAEKSDA